MPKIFLDTTVIIAYLNKKDSHHRDVKALIDFVKEKYIADDQSKKFFITNEITILETISKLVHQRKTVKESIKKLKEFIIDCNLSIISRGSKKFVEVIYGLYSEFSRRKFKKLQCNDFLIIADSIKSGSLLVTCDEHFIELTSKNFPDVYYLSSKSKKVKDQYIKLLKRFFN